MEKGVIYVPVKPNFAFADLVWKEDDSTLGCANMPRIEPNKTEEIPTRKVSGFKALSEEMKLPPKCAIHLYIVPKPVFAENMKVQNVKELLEDPSINLSVFILQVPSDYGHGENDTE